MYVIGQVVDFVELIKPPVQQPDLPAAWYVLLTEPNAETTAVSGLVGRGVTAYGPTVHKKIIKRGRKIEDVRPMFPGYIFAHLAAGSHDFHVPKRVAGVRDYLRLSMDGRGTPEPYPLPDGLVEAIVDREADELDRFQASKGVYKFRKDQDVRVSEGPFSGFPARVSGLDDRGRVQALLDLFGRMTPVTFDVAQLEAV